jgi:hypothetical protein
MGATKVEHSFLSEGLLANIVGNLFSGMIRDLRCDRSQKPQETL